MKIKDIWSEYDKNCGLCENSVPLSDGNCLCQRKGVVASDYKCRHFSFDLTKLKFNVNQIRIESTEEVQSE